MMMSNEGLPSANSRLAGVSPDVNCPCGQITPGERLAHPWARVRAVSRVRQ